MKILSAEQIRAIDAYTIEHEPVLSIDLMERAAVACFKALESEWNKSEPIAVFCGMGNNGGDGLALTRLLNQNGFKANAYLIKHNEKASNDNQINHKRLKTSFPKQILEINDGATLGKLPVENFKLIIDALLGTGLNKTPEGFPNNKSLA